MRFSLAGSIKLTMFFCLASLALALTARECSAQQGGPQYVAPQVGVPPQGGPVYEAPYGGPYGGAGPCAVGVGGVHGNPCLMHFGPRRCGAALRHAGCNGGVVPMVLGGAPGQRRSPSAGYVAPWEYGYWAEYGFMGPQYGAWYGLGYNYYSHTGDYATPYLPPPSMRGPGPGF
jgi:hypothetical protein